jgi:hypothetical protein
MSKPSETASREAHRRIAVRERIRASSRAVAEHIRQDPEAAEFVQDWTMPSAIEVAR